MLIKYSYHLKHTDLIAPMHSLCLYVPVVMKMGLYHYLLGWYISLQITNLAILVFFLHLSDPMSLTATPNHKQSADQWIPVAHRVRFLKKWVYENPRAGARGSTVDHGLSGCLVVFISLLLWEVIQESGSNNQHQIGYHIF